MPFQSTPPRGGRHRRAGAPRSALPFQSTPPRGGRPRGGARLSGAHHLPPTLATRSTRPAASGAPAGRDVPGSRLARLLTGEHGARPAHTPARQRGRRTPVAEPDPPHLPRAVSLGFAPQAPDAEPAALDRLPPALVADSRRAEPGALPACSAAVVCPLGRQVIPRRDRQRRRRVDVAWICHGHRARHPDPQAGVEPGKRHGRHSDLDLELEAEPARHGHAIVGPRRDGRLDCRP